MALERAILERKRIFPDVFILLAVFLAAVMYAKGFNPFLYPGIEDRFVFPLAITGFFTFVLYFPFARAALFLSRIFFISWILKVFFPRLIEKIPVKIVERHIYALARAMFYVFFSLFLIVIISSQFISGFPGFLSVFDLTIASSICGSLYFYMKGEKPEKKISTSRQGFFAIAVFAVAVSLLLLSKLPSLGAFAYIVAIFCLFCLLFLLFALFGIIS